MPKPPLCFFIIFLFLSQPLFSQIIVSGIVTSTKKEPLNKASVSLANPGDQSKLIYAVTTDSSGSFRFPVVVVGKYFLRIKAIGFKSKILQVTITDQVKEQKIGIVVLEEYTELLKEVKIKTQQPLYEQKLDRLIVNVQQNSIAANGTALEVLERSPGVEVEKQKNRISLNGKDGVMIMINGKLTYQPMDAVIRMLSAMEAKNLQRIELISNPSAEFDASGSGGLINIVLLKNKKNGFNGNYGASVGYGYKEKSGINLDFNYSHKGFNLYGISSQYRDHTKQKFTNNRDALINDDFNNRFVTSLRDPVQNNIYSRLGIDFTIDSSLTIGTSVSGFNNVWDMKANNRSLITDNHVLSSSIAVDNTERNRLNNLDWTFFVSKKMKQRAEINLDLDYLYYDNNDGTGYLNSYYDSSGNLTTQQNLSVRKLTPVKIGVAKLDYKAFLGSGVEWKSGIKYSFSSLTNNVNASTLTGSIMAIDYDLSNNAIYTEDIGALYTLLNMELNKTTRFNIGLRYEYANTVLGESKAKFDLKRNQGNLFPSLFFSKHISTNNSIQLSYSKRIARPSFNDLAPFVIFLDPSTYFYGNPDLRSSISSVYKIDYLYRRYLLTLEYNHASNAISSYQATFNNETNQQIFTSVNLKYSNSYSCTIALPVTMNKWWDMRFNFLGVKQELRTAQLINNVSLSQLYCRLNSTQSFKLSDSYSIDLLGIFQSKKLGGISQVSPRGRIDFGLQKKLDRNTIRFSFENIFATNNEVNYTNVPNNNLNIREVYKYEPRIVKLSISHRFGNADKKIAERDNGAEEIRNRIH